ncbi:endonuclease/exonuclease/phosphatase family protein [Paraliomyxa miuraensis]|uniref:endonuclease/exonuclease/phosphatase family protein n=1 Tax=Paraliomyxa miuraensis TaxID=376150 RepID=UPI0022594242|nr:endonuclease/exonuclease/phosphatase family protein [Paraliomyxa miuraensis]MCX4241554.1 endonuclease/exonuclease/phosphatase family protein [Paraliomyxa miuraensis]
MPERRLRLVTWNVWFGQWRREERQAALWAEIERLEPDVVCLQEVVPEHLAGPEIERLRARGWWVSDEALYDYDVVVLSRVPVRSSERMPLPSMMGRELLTSWLAGEPPLIVATVHLESTAEMTEFRLVQLEQISSRLESERDIVLVGDMNFPAEPDRPESAALADWTDAWAQVRGDEPGYTIDTTVNRMRWLAKRKHDHRRIDRVFVRSDRWRVEAIEIVGTTPLPGDPLTFVSDHLGLCADLVADG